MFDLTTAVNKEAHSNVIAKIMVQLEKTIPKTHQKNGVIERMYLIINDRIRCILAHVKLPKSICGKVMTTTTNLINLSPILPLKGDVL